MSERLAHDIHAKRSVAAIVERFRLLDPGAQRIVACAALIGARPDLPLLVACGDEPLESTIAAMERAGVLDLVVVESRVPPLFRFRHALTRSAIAESLGSAQARLLHGRIAAALEELPDSLSRLDQIAHHWAQAEVIE
jgi:predicted ATPase